MLQLLFCSEIDESVRESHNKLIIATNDVLQNGLGDGRGNNLTRACEDVADLVDLSCSLIPSSRPGVILIYF